MGAKENLPKSLIIHHVWSSTTRIALPSGLFFYGQQHFVLKHVKLCNSKPHNHAVCFNLCYQLAYTIMANLNCDLDFRGKH